ncbi:MAG: hypothetical protein A2571_02635 [Candidatus Vogelbacteria bacterium RIFOXYD1_FULL_44_32]|uniref:SMC-Scp complex subunit ScpB n=1 Tax=Candidatus Vogelbacteria bacterium RIFOXYD1_FULL_44_32 TaxID=1802438 RepID=A0A1G2QF84_9BACT|nr:MAG: hypothetical protein A2571_02635 [Candidatus Vogelbacteria bacterium RIFOXYD1_FULL_44_32]
MNLACQIEAVLFYKAEPMLFSVLAKMLSISEGELKEAGADLEKNLAGRGIRLLSTESSYALVTAGDASELIEKITKDELARDIGKAGLETLAIILYRGQVSRAEIDYIRGVNSSFILRHLLIRGLILRETSPTDQRSFLYQPSTELMATLGIEKAQQLPDFAEIEEKIKIFMSTQEEIEAKATENEK